MSQGMQPPQSQELTATIGPQLLGYIRSLDAATASSSDAPVEQAVSCLQCLVSVASRQGILQNDINMAESLIMASAASSTSQTSQSKKRRSFEDKNDSNTTTLSNTLPVQLVTTALVRILTVKGDMVDDPDLSLLMTLAADLIRAVVQHVQHDQNIRPLICRQAESEWIKGSAKALLSALSQSIPKLIVTLQTYDTESSVEAQAALISCLYACADLIDVVGTKLSRSQAILSALQQVAWDITIMCPTSAGIDAAAAATRLLATLPLAGGTDRATPSSLWMKTMQQTQNLIWMFLQRSLPVSQRIKAKDNVALPESLQRNFDDWWASLGKLESQHQRAARVLNLLESLVTLWIELMQKGQDTMALLDTTVDVPSVLDLVDALLALPLSAEASYFGTKKRLREEPLDNSVLSPASIATHLANHVFLQGQKLLAHLVSGLKGPSLLPFAQRLRQLGYASVLTACSPVLRQVLEPGYGVSKKRRWLPHSVLARTSALHTLQKLVVALGVKATSERKTRKRVSDDTDRMVKVVSGCLLEQLYPYEDESYDWGSAMEKIDLIIAASDCLACILTSGGEFLSMPSRQLLDSVASTCLSYMTESNNTSATSSNLRSTSLYASFLELGKACVSTSWPDGAASLLRDGLRQAAISAGYGALSQVAASARQLCDALTHPTVPALYVVTRQTEDIPTATADALKMKMEQVRTAAKAQQQRNEEEQERKKAKLERKQVVPSNRTTPILTQFEHIEGSSIQLEPERSPLVAKKDDHGTFDAPKMSETCAKETPTAVNPEEKTTNPREETSVNPLPIPDQKTSQQNEESDLDDDFPMIVDAGPDEDDIKEDDEDD